MEVIVLSLIILGSLKHKLITAADSLAIDDRIQLFQLSDFYSTHRHKRISEGLEEHTVLQMVSFIRSVSPPHIFYVLYDDSVHGMDSQMQMYSGIGIDVTVMKFPSQVESIFDILLNIPNIAITSRRHVLVLCSIENTARIFKMIASKYLESRTLFWILIAMDEEAAKALQGIGREGSQVVLFEKKSEDTYNILTLLTDNAGIARFENVGDWSLADEGGYNARLLSPDIVFRDLEDVYSNFNGREIIVTANNHEPFTLMKEDSNGILQPIAGFEFIIVDELSRVLNFTYKVSMPSDGQWGRPLANGTVNGIIGVVSRREAHFSICEITITRLRETVIDYTYPYYTESLTLISRAPREKNRSFAAFYPFTAVTWLAIAATVLFMGPVLFFQSKVMDCYLPEKQVYSMNNFLFNMFGCLLKQPNRLKHSFEPHYFTFIFWYLFCLIISVFYDGMLIATLIKPSFEKPINGLADLPEAIENGFTFVVTAETSMEYLFRDAEDGIYAQSWQMFNHEDKSKSFVEYSIDHYDRIPEDKLVLVNGQLLTTFHATIHGINRYHIARDSFAPQFYGAVCYSGSPFLPIINKMFAYIIESGLIPKWVSNEFQTVSGNNILIQSSGARPFTINHLQAAFYILLIGSLISTAAFALEMLFSVCRRSFLG